MKRKTNKFKVILTAILDRLPKTQYYACFSRDCDMCERTWASKYPNKYQAKKAYESLIDGAEGPIGFEPITKQEFENFENGHRDRCLEAWENGNGTSIYV
jgi:hypothetical protein